MLLNAPVSASALDLDLLARLCTAALLGLALGIDREWQGHAAGLRTHGIVCLTSAAMTVAIIAIYLQLDGERMDPLRIFEATGAFIGIVGAGLIVFSKGEVKNITTAVHLWLTAVVGIACGAALWPVVIVLAVVGFLMLTVLGFVERRVLQRSEENAR
ncbi:MgtC/SapB family transporter [Altererythrobacter sp. B11]|uniref:MgtC/SapB family protein n=1 Tax=Altererythrobacter sp. B11 TaxID=2060312 RepID=UPI000DC70D3A|nr:MgtC/SapB family protein [Altererythrobacter sp. B11]BBC72782.1 MgtC/SapB family transporter [Altererythrobacter sp. B11]